MQKISAAFLFFVLFSTPAHGQMPRIDISCSDVEYIFISYFPEEVENTFPGCEKECYFPSYRLNYTTASRVQRVLNERKGIVQQVYLEDSLLVTLEPEPWDTPLALDIMSQVDGFYPTYGDALAHGLAICPDTPLGKSPY